MTNQFTDEQIEAACVAYEYTNELIEELRERAVSDSPAHTLMREAADALEAAAGIAPQAESERESDKECPHTPRDEWRRRGYCHRCTVEAGWTLLSDQEARRELPVQPSSTVDERKLADVIAKASLDYNLSDRSGESYACGAPDYRSAFIARAVVEAIGGEGRAHD